METSTVAVHINVRVIKFIPTSSHNTLLVFVSGILFSMLVASKNKHPDEIVFSWSNYDDESDNGWLKLISMGGPFSMGINILSDIGS